MRLFKVVAAILLSAGVASPLLAQGAPAEFPPTSFKGQQYVDSRGCVFLRAGYGGQVQWVQRINANRKPLCGYPPTFGAVNVEVADAVPTPDAQPPVKTQVAAVAPAPKVAPVVVAQPAAPAPQAPMVKPAVRIATSAQQPAAPAPEVLAAAPAPQVAATGPGPGKIGCYKSAPVAMIVPLRGGGTAVVCTKGDGSMDGWRPPVYPAGAPVGASLNLPRLAGYQMNGNGTLVATGGTPQVPKGYKAAWDDDRLNPARSLGTADGRAKQDNVWSQEVPAKQVAAANSAKPSGKTKTTVSTNTNATAATGTYYVQVGTFGVPENASGAAARLSSIGLPAAKGKMSSKGKILQIVYAGPFATKAEAQAALTAARAAGFSDAILR